MDEPQEKHEDFAIGEDLYGISVAELDGRIVLLKAEIKRIETELAKKQKDLNAAQQLFS